MRTVVYAPFVLSVVVVALARCWVNRLQPRAAAWAISVAAVALAASTAGALVLLASPMLARLPIIAELGRWQPQSVELSSPVPVWLSIAALACVAWLGWLTGRELRRLMREFDIVVGAHAQFANYGGGEVVVVDGAIPAAHAVSRTLTQRGRVVLTTAMLELLDDEERAAVVAHERAHLRHGHGAFVAVTRLAGALNPLLAPMRCELEYALERWADEDAASVTHRTVIASALAKASIAVLQLAVPTAAGMMSLHAHAVADRVSALLDAPTQRTRFAWALLTVAAIAIASLLWAMHDTERFFEAARLWHQR